MRDAARDGDLEEVKRLVKAGHDVNQRDGEERTPLIWAAEREHTDCMEYLIQNGAQLDLKNIYGNTALHLAARGGHLEVMKRLVEAGQDVNQKDWTDRTPLMLAARGGYTDCVEYLLHKGAQLDLKDELGMTALHLAAVVGHLEVMKRLVAAGADVNQRAGMFILMGYGARWGRTPLMIAAENRHPGHTDCVEYLLQNGAQLDLKNWRGNTALKIASQGRNDSTVKLLQTAADKGE